MAQSLGPIATKIVANPLVVVDKALTEGTLRHAADTKVPTGTLSDTCIFVPVPVDAVVIDVLLSAADQGTTGLLDIGLFKKNVDGTFTAVDADCLGNDVDVKAGALVRSNVRFQNQAITTINSKAWELAGLSARPTYDYVWVGITVAEALQVPAAVTIEVKFKV